MSEEIRTLISRCRTGDQTAMQRLVQRFKGQVYGLCYRMLGHHQDAEDTAQETFVRALRSLHQWDSQRRFEPWLLAIAGNRCRTMLAKRQRRPAPQALLEPPLDPTPDRQAAEQLTEEVQLALLDIRQEYRQAFLLFHENECSYAEISQAMNCPLGTVKTWVHRARRELIDRLRARGVLEECDGAMRRV